MRAHIIENGKVINTVEVASLDVFPGSISAENGGNIGDSWDGQVFTPPTPEPEPVPESVTMRQARLELLSQGLLSTVDAAVAAQGEAAGIEWEYATEVRYDWPLVVQLCTALSLDRAALFISAAKR